MIFQNRNLRSGKKTTVPVPDVPEQKPQKEREPLTKPNEHSNPEKPVLPKEKPIKTNPAPPEKKPLKTK